MRYASSAVATCRALRSASEYTATVRAPRRFAVRMTRQAISPRLAMRIRSNTASPPLHPEHAEAGFPDRRVQRDGERQRQHVARLDRVDDAVVPEPRRGVERVALVLELVDDGLLEGGLVLGADGAAAALDALAAHRGQHARRLLAAHHRDAAVGPGPEESRRIG